jgi:hypothetical protein
MLVRFNYVRASLIIHFVRNCCVTGFCSCKIGIPYMLYTSSVLDRPLKYILVLGNCLRDTRPSGRRTAASIQSNMRLLFGLRPRPACQLLAVASSALRLLELIVMYAVFSSGPLQLVQKQKIITKTLLLLDPPLR